MQAHQKNFCNHKGLGINHPSHEDNHPKCVSPASSPKKALKAGIGTCHQPPESRMPIDMRAVVQRVSGAEVQVEGATVGKIGPGLLVFLGIEKTDTNSDLEWLADRLPRIRCFEDADGRMNRCLRDVGGAFMVIRAGTGHPALRSIHQTT